jgi:hypothetical protein
MRRFWNWIRGIFKKDEVYSFIVTKNGIDELWVYKNGKRIK